MKMSNDLNWALQADEAEAEIKLSGEIDFSSSNALRAELAKFIKRTTGPVRIDLSDLEYLDSSGLAVLIGMRNQLNESNRKLTVTAIHPNAEKVFRLTQVSSLFGI